MKRPIRYIKACYSLDADDGIEYSACQHKLTPDEVLELKERFCRLWNARNSDDVPWATVAGQTEFDTI